MFTYAILSGCPSPTDSEVKRKLLLAVPLVIALIMVTIWIEDEGKGNFTEGKRHV